MVCGVACPNLSSRSFLLDFAIRMICTLHMRVFLLMIILNIFVRLSLTMFMLLIPPFLILLDILLVTCLLAIAIFLPPDFLCRNEDQNHKQYQRYFHLIIILIFK